MLVLVCLSLAISVLTNEICSHTTDPPGQVRAGDDIRCISMSKDSTTSDCISACCNEKICKSFSWNDPWTITPYMGCHQGSNCCCLKSSVPPLEKNKWPMNITTGVISPKPCKTSLDCSLNGDCLNGVCKCDAAWKGNDCGELNLLPVDSLQGAYQHPYDPVYAGTSSWGGLPLKNQIDGKYHLFASQFVQNCTLAGWNPGSTVIRAISDKIEGPYTYVETVFGTFHHNPTVRRLSPEQSGTGKEMFLMLMIGSDSAPPKGSGFKCKYDAAADPHHLEGYITMAWSTSITGPWVKSRHTSVTSGMITEWDAMVTNPAPLILKNGTAFLYFRGTKWPVNGYERIGLAKANSWKGPYGRVTDDALCHPFNDTTTFMEDPWVWEDNRGVHMVAHGHWDEKGYLAFSETPEGPWTCRREPTYTNVVQTKDGKEHTLAQRERPQLWLDEVSGKPTWLFTGVAPPGGKFYGYTYTFAQPINT